MALSFDGLMKVVSTTFCQACPGLKEAADKKGQHRQNRTGYGWKMEDVEMMLIYCLVSLLSVFCQAFPATCQKKVIKNPYPVYLNIEKAMLKCGYNAQSLEIVLKTSDEIAKEFGCFMVYYWQPKEGSHFVDITQNVIDKLRKK